MAYRNAAGASLRRKFRVFAFDGRVLAQNADGKLIDIGTVTHEAHGYVARLDVDGTGTKPHARPELALSDLKSSFTFDYLDGLFTAVVDEHPHVLLDSCPSVEFALEEPAPTLTGAGSTRHRV